VKVTDSSCVPGVEHDAFERRVDQRAGDAAVDRRVQLRTGQRRAVDDRGRRFHVIVVAAGVTVSDTVLVDAA
jgi:hypothetical protein